MKATYHRFKGIGVTVYYLNCGEKVARHVHSFEHTTAVSVGRSKVTIDGDPPFEMIPGKGDFVLPAKRYHEIEALEDGTIVIHMSSTNNEFDSDTSYIDPSTDPNALRPGYIPRKSGGVLMDDGSVQYREK